MEKTAEIVIRTRYTTEEDGFIGYSETHRPLVLCEDCENKRGENGDFHCYLDGRGIRADSFCSYGERSEAK